MELGALGAALEREHHEIDAGVATFRSGATEAEQRIAALRTAVPALRRHIYLEEQFLFPSMQADLAIPTMVMLREHGELWRTLDALEAKLDEHGASGEADAICAALMGLLERHNAKEEPIFYTQADTLLTPAAAAQLQGFLDTGEMPADWICQGARRRGA